MGSTQDQNVNIMLRSPSVTKSILQHSISTYVTVLVEKKMAWTQCIVLGRTQEILRYDPDPKKEKG